MDAENALDVKYAEALGVKKDELLLSQPDTGEHTTKKDDKDSQASGRKAALDEALKRIEKNFGKGSIMVLGDNALTQVETYPSGSVKLDVALGVGGYPNGIDYFWQNRVVFSDGL
ncbi:hypothetical protein GQS40_07215|uniref:Protein RecA n=1 Tax=Leuconostoc lactis TaxID=1246 RepID=A0A6L7A7U1_LEULA|nr:hypothetical protein [Leuconostoc lactis]